MRLQPATIFHGTPLTPVEALEQLVGRNFCVSYFRPDSVARVERIAARIMYDCGAFSFWMQARRAGLEWEEVERCWHGYYEWTDARLWHPGRWAVIPDRIGAPSQLNDALLNEWPHGRSRGAPVYHMDEPLTRLGRLAERYDRVCIGWVHPDRIENRVGSASFRRAMDELCNFVGNRPPALHGLRMVDVAEDYDIIETADSTALAQNGHRYRMPLFRGTPAEFTGLIAYADKLERMR